MISVQQHTEEEGRKSTVKNIFFEKTGKNTNLNISWY